MRWLGWVVGLAALIAAGGGGCGSGGGDGDNDQGISFRAVGFFSGPVEEGMCEIPAIDSAIVDQSFVISLYDPLLDFGFPPFLGSCLAFIELQNNLFNQAITATAITFEYEIPGAKIAIPANTVNAGQRINPVNSEEPTISGAPNVIFYQPTGQLVANATVLFLRQNILSFPPLPFPMIIRTTAFGVSDTGNEFVTNEISYTIEFLP
jgi:hypothetical protein